MNRITYCVVESPKLVDQPVTSQSHNHTSFHDDFSQETDPAQLKNRQNSLTSSLIG